MILNSLGGLEEMLPNLIIIGAVKCGTTSLHYYLSLHPEIAMSHPKELHFFSSDQNWSKGVEWYESHFIKRAKIRGESTPMYTRYPLITVTPERMYSIIPEAKLIYILRDPIDRFISEYRHRRAEGADNRTLSEALSDLKNNQYVYNSKYYTQLEQYLKFYPGDSIFITTLEELNRQPQQTMQKVFGFLGVDDSLYHSNYTKRLHITNEKRLKNWLGLFLTRKFRENQIKKKIWPILPSYVKRTYFSLSRSNVKVEKPALNDNQRQALIEELKNDVHQLKNYTGKNFEYWCL